MRTADKWLRICNCLLRPERVAVKRRPARVHPPQWGTECLPATVERVRATVSHTVVIPYGHRGIYIPPPVIHPPDSSLQRCQVTSTASLRSHVHSPVAPLQAHNQAGGSQGSHPPALIEEEFQNL